VLFPPPPAPLATPPPHYFPLPRPKTLIPQVTTQSRERSRFSNCPFPRKLDLPQKSTKNPDNNYFDFIPKVLLESPGIVLIDELDVHLHPKWQRQVVEDLKRTFPCIQFVCTSHSPFIIQSLKEGELRTLDPSEIPPSDYANDSIEDIAEHIQHVEVPQQSQHAQKLAKITQRYYKLLEDESLDKDSKVLLKAEAEYRTASKRYSANPGLSAILELKALAREAKNGK